MNGGISIQKIPVKYKDKTLYALVDDEDYLLVSQYKWTYTYNRKDLYGYARTAPYIADSNGNKKRVYIRMHRLILNAQPGQEVDHRNNNGLDNRKSNIWICTREENLTNRRLNNKYRLKHTDKIWR